MKNLIVGLGNPEKKYKNNRHNIGFQIVDALLEQIERGARKKKKDSFAEMVIIKNKKAETFLVKPLTFMNNSGLAVKKIIKEFKIKPENLILIHDEIDLPFGKIKISKNSSSAGHKGVESVIDALKTKNFTRIRVGINPGFKTDTAEFVLKNFSAKEKRGLPEIKKRVIAELDTLLSLHP